MIPTKTLRERMREAIERVRAEEVGGCFAPSGIEDEDKSTEKCKRRSTPSATRA